MATALEQFVAELMSLGAGYAGMGGASAAIVGASGSHNDVVQDLRQHTIAFATEHQKPSPDPARLADLKAQLSGSILSLKLISVISDDKLTRLLAELDEL